MEPTWTNVRLDFLMNGLNVTIHAGFGSEFLSAVRTIEAKPIVDSLKQSELNFSSVKFLTSISCIGKKQFLKKVLKIFNGLKPTKCHKFFLSWICER